VLTCSYAYLTLRRVEGHTELCLLQIEIFTEKPENIGENAVGP
jgi:hypothetical protein